MRDAIAQVGAAHVEMAVDNGRYRIPPMPILSLLGAAPKREAGDAGNGYEIVAQGEMAGEDERALFSSFCQAGFCVATTDSAPFFAGT